MHRARSVIVASIAAIFLGWVVPVTPANADALYAAGDAGTWSWNDTCDSASWSHQYSLWYIVNQVQDYVFDIPDPSLVPGETLTVALTPMVVGSLPGSVSLSGTSTITGVVPKTNPNPGDTMWQAKLSEQTFTVAYQPGERTTGSLPVPAEWAGQYAGFAALQAKITGDLGSQSTIVMLVWPFKVCGAPATDTSPTADVDHGSALSIGLLAFAVAIGLLSITLRGTARRWQEDQ